MGSDHPVTAKPLEGGLHLFQARSHRHRPEIRGSDDQASRGLKPRGIGEMCGRYRRTTQEEELARINTFRFPSRLICRLANIAPSQKIVTIRYNRRRTNVRRCPAMGPVPYWAKDSKTYYKTINARVETVDTTPGERGGGEGGGGGMPADGFYEWKRVVGGKIPYSIGRTIRRSYLPGSGKVGRIPPLKSGYTPALLSPDNPTNS